MGFNRGLDLNLLLLAFALLAAPVIGDLVISKAERRIDLTSQVVRITSTLKVENEGNNAVSEFLLALPDHQANHLAYIAAVQSEGRGKTRAPGVGLPVHSVQPDEKPPTLTYYSISLPKKLAKGESLNLEVLAVLTHVLKPYPEKITQDDYQLVLFQDTGYYLSPYAVKVQTLTVKLPDARIESYTKLENTKLHGSEIKYGPYADQPPFQYSPVVFHFEDNQPFAVAEKFEREIEISHWGNVQITEHYNIIHGGAHLKGEFSRLDYQVNPRARGAAAFSRLTCKLPPRAHSVYYRDEIGNISTSNLWSDSKRTELQIEPRYPLFGGWKTFFTIGYGLPLKDYLFQSEGKRFLNISFGSPMNDLVVDELTVKVVLPEGSTDISVSVPFSVEQAEETKISHLDITGRPVIVLQKKNAVPEHNQHFQVYYKFSNISLLREPLMLVSGFFFLFVACIVYMHADVTISKTSASYLAKLQWDEVQATVQQLQSIFHRCLSIHNNLEASLHELSRSGNVQACKAARKSADGLLKELSKEMKPLLSFLQSSPQASHIWPKVEELVAKERELQEKLMAKHTTVVDCYEKKVSGREIENRVSSVQQKIKALRQDVDDLLEYIDEI